MNKKKFVEKNFKFFMITFSILVILFSVGLVSATTTINSPAAGTNYSSLLSVNVTTDVSVSYNISLYYNATGGSDLTIFTTNESMSGPEFFNTTLDISSLSDGASYNITFAVSNSTTLEWAEAVIIGIDNTPPQVVAGNITFPLTGGNYSNKGHGLLSLSVSIADATLFVDSVFFNVTNATKTQNATLDATASGSTWTVNLNTSHFPDGIYNITVWANDSINVNNSAFVYSVTFDNTNPTASLTCTPDPVDQGSTITCSCSTSDATSGVKSSSNTANPSTANSGPYTTTCSVTDYANHTVTGSYEYTVSGISSGGSGGGGGGSISSPLYTGQVTLSESQLSSGFGARITKTTQMTLKIQTSSSSSVEDHELSVSDVQSDRVTVVISSDPISVELKSGETKKVDIDDDGTYDLSVKLNSVSGSIADVTVTKIEEEKLEGEQEGQVSEGAIEEEGTSDEGVGSEVGGMVGWIVGILVIIIIVVVVVVLLNSKKGKKSNR